MSEGRGVRVVMGWGGDMEVLVGCGKKDCGFTQRWGANGRLR